MFFPAVHLLSCLEREIASKNHSDVYYNVFQMFTKMSSQVFFRTVCVNVGGETNKILMS